MKAPPLATLVLALAAAAPQFNGTNGMEQEVAALDSRLRGDCGSPRDKEARLSELEQKLAEADFQQESLTFRFAAIQTHVFKFRAQDFRGLNVTSEMAQDREQRSTPWHAMRFPAELMKGVRAREVEQKLVCIYIHSPCIFQDARNSSVLNNNILGAFLRNSRVTNLSRPVEIQFHHNKVLDTSNATCVFWLADAGGRDWGSWSSEGCETRHSPGTVLCQCNHLTYFAVLLITSGNISQAELVSLTYISIVGCSISAAASLFTILLYCIFRRRKSDDTTKIHMNLLGALFLLNSGFLLSEPLALASVGLCRAAAAFLHGCLLCTFAWMAAEAFHLYLLLIKVYNVYVRRYLLKLCLFGWGLPALVVISILLFKKDAYGYHDIETGDGYKNATMCWLTSQEVHYGTLCYAGLILLINTLVLLIVMRMLRSRRHQKGMARKDWVTVLGLTYLLGTTWGLAFFSFGVFFIPQLYLFTILNSLQGLFICLWYHTVHRRTDRDSSSTTSNTTK
ncbi:adhesion G-protein coupled receptor G5 [Dromaius novaehollandiae]|uniref:adhesion G-protein coupled receptor G5 n=1 Tax=Dromaius novaehollandiae TaxID=8790 RepID=UPI00311DA5E7